MKINTVQSVLHNSAINKLIVSRTFELLRTFEESVSCYMKINND